MHKNFGRWHHAHDHADSLNGLTHALSKSKRLAGDFSQIILGAVQIHGAKNGLKAKLHPAAAAVDPKLLCFGISLNFSVHSRGVACINTRYLVICVLLKFGIQKIALNLYRDGLIVNMSTQDKKARRIHFLTIKGEFRAWIFKP